MWKYGRYSERKKRKSPFSPIPLSFKVWLLRCIFRISGRSTIPRPQLRCLHRTESAFRAPIIQTVVDLSPPLLWLSTTMSVTLLPLRRQPPGGSSTCEDTFICFYFYPPLHRYVFSRRTSEILIKTRRVQSLRMPNVCFVGGGRFVECDLLLRGCRNKIQKRRFTRPLSVTLLNIWKLK